MTVPYTYLIGWSKQQMYYYGVRYARGCSPLDLWVTYFTSSNSVKKYREIHGEPDIINIRKTFVYADAARLWEEKLLKKINAAQHPSFLNKANGKAIPLDLSTHRGEHHGMWGKKHTVESIAKMKGPKSNRHKELLKGRRPHVCQTGVLNNAFKGFINTPYGKFSSLKEAAAVEGIHFSTISLRINSNHNVLYYRSNL